MFSIQEQVCQTQITQMTTTLLKLESLLNLNKETLFVESKGETVQAVIELWIAVYALKELVIQLMQALLSKLVQYLDEHMQFEQAISNSFS